ncbi:ArsR/SmtB family transcription factor [Halorussus halobius]|uniref:ArsR/SmtB family transcription factor n=1 Tax=Halorussus halobius TaxID=1710537 RepID=UPI001092912B|nr:helix-turn-helix domain-containing protein [Halorussus halobius]
MADLLPSSPDPAAGEDGAPRVIGVDSDDADDLLAALQSETARDLLAALYDEPATPSALADEIDTSIQNVRYHLEKLTDADLVEGVDTVYSEKGREMTVYAPAAKPLVVFAGSDDETSGLEDALSRLLGGLGVLALSSLVVQRFASEGSLLPSLAMGNSGDAGGGGAGDAATETAASQGGATTTSASGATGGGDGAGTNASEEVATDSPGANGAGPNADATETATPAPTESDDVGIFDVTEETAEPTTVEEAAQPTGAEDAAEPTTVEEAVETTRTVADAGGDAATDLVETTRAATDAVEPTTVDAAGDAAATLPPGLLFFAGGLVVLAALGVAWYLRER